MKRHRGFGMCFIILLIIGMSVYTQYIITADSSLVYAANTTAAIKKTNNMLPLFWMVAIVGGCIAITLSYVSWRKFKGERKKHIKKDSNS